MSKVVGIDLGTTYSLISHLRCGRPEVIPNAEKALLTPSVVALLEGGKTLVGGPAKAQASVNPENTVFSIKRKMGRTGYLGDSGTTRQIKRHMGSGMLIGIDGRMYSPEEVSAMILRKLKLDAERYLGEEVEKAVISVPAYFNITQRRATADAARIAGLEVLRIIDEPTAAALAYGVELEDIHTVVVWDLGGGTFDVSVLDIGEGVLSVKSVNGDTELGGDDFSLRLSVYLAGELKKEYGLGPGEDRGIVAMLREAAEGAKEDLSFIEFTEVFLRLGVGEGSRLWRHVISRKRFEELTSDLLKRMVGPTEQALVDAGLKPSDVDRCILVGGSTRMPQVRRLFTELMGKPPYVDLQPDEAVAMGAAIQAGILTGEIKGKVLVDVTPLSLGIETEGGVFAKIIERNTTIPVSRSRVFTNAADSQTSMSIHVLQGERALSAHNQSVGKFELDGIPPAPRGEGLVEVTFEIDADGILRINARDLHTDNSKNLRVSPRFYGLSDEEISRMIAGAEGREAEDRGELLRVQSNTRARNLISSGQRIIEELQSGEHGVSRAEIQKAEEAILELEAVMGKEVQLVVEKAGGLEDCIMSLKRRISAVERKSRPDTEPF
jgi:molecular chaperone DnaK